MNLKFLTYLILILAGCTCDLFSQTIVPWTGGDDGPAIQAALKNHTSVALESGKVYRTSVFLTMPSGVTFSGNGSTIKPHSNLPSDSKALIGTAPSWEIKTHEADGLNVNVECGSKSFTYSGAANIKVGQLVQLTGPIYRQLDSAAHYYRCGWFGLVTAISGSTVTLSSSSERSYVASSIAVYEPTRNIHLKDIHLDLRGRTSGTGASMNLAVNSSMDYVSVECDPDTALGISVGIKVSGVNIVIDHATVKNIRPLETGSGVSYGIDVAGSNITVSNPYVRNVETCITSAGRDYFSTDIKYLNVDVDNMQGAGHCLDFHGNASGVMKGGVVVCGAKGGGAIAVRNSNTRVEDLVIKCPNPNGMKTKRSIFIFENAASNVFITNNRFEYTGTNGVCYAVGNSGAAIAPTSNLKINGNLFLGCEVNFSAPFRSGIEISNNWFETTGKFQSKVYISTSSPGEYKIIGNKFINRVLNNSFNFSISTPKYPAKGRIKQNKVYIMDKANDFEQFRINNTVNVVQFNEIYCSTGKFIWDLSDNPSLNTINNNTVHVGLGDPGSRPVIPNVISPNTTSTKDYFIDLGGTSSISPQTSPDEKSRKWNNLTSGALNASVGGLIDSQGTASTKLLKVIDGFWDNGDGTACNNNGTTTSTVYTAKATSDSFFVGNHLGVIDNTAKLRLEGLRSDAKYRIRLYASRMSSDLTTGRTTVYTVTGSNTGTKELNALNNVNAYSEFTDVLPANNSIDITCTAKSGCKYGYLGVIQLTEIAPAK